MTPAFIFLLLLSLTAVTSGATDDEVETDSSSSVSEIIARANAGITTRLVHDDIVPNLNRNADPCTARGCLWPKRGSRVIVPVTISSSYTRTERWNIIKALITFHKSTCIRFVWKHRSHQDYINFFPGTGCWSYLGRQSGRQPISLKKKGCLYQDTIQHEVLHALGFHHEHVRSDRDRYVSILTENIQPGKESNFQKVETNNLDTSYDFDSVMQYSNYAFSKNGSPTIVAKSDPNFSFGRAREMSANDIARVNSLYQCYLNSTMDVSEETEDGVSEDSVSEQHDSKIRAKSLVNWERPDPPVPSCLSMRSDRSMYEPVGFKDGGQSEKQIPVNQERPEPPVPSCLSMRSDRSMYEPVGFKDGGQSEKQIPVNQERPDSSVPSCLSMKSDQSKMEPIEFKDEGPIADPGSHRPRSEVVSHRPAPNLDSVFLLLEENIMTFVKNELKKFKNVLSSEDQEYLEKLREDDEVMGGEGEVQRYSNRDAFLTITLNFLRGIKHKQLADSLQSKTLAAISQCKLKSKVKDNFQCLFEGIAKAGNPTLLNRIYTELYITEGDNREVNYQHEVRQIEAASRKPASSEATIRCEDMFKPLPGRDEPVRTLVTKGVAGIGKTVLTQKYILDWAEDKANHNIQFLFPFTFRELNLLKEKKYSLVELLDHFFTETKEAGMCRFEGFQVVFIFDGLDECRLPLDFHNNEILTDVTESTSIEVLLTNLIRGKLLPSARLWITTRPAAANQIPPECIDMVTEVRGFTDPQKEEYFRKRFRDEEQANRIISHIETSRSLHIMCHIPVFCWITATVLEDVLKVRQRAELPKTLTEMYIHFLVVQTKQWNVKYHSSVETDQVWNTKTKNTLLTLGKLAFEQLEKGNLIFYEADLKECGIDIKAASVYSGVFTEILKEGHELNKERVFCFVHRSIQEFLAALYVFLMFINTGVDLLRKRLFTSVQPMPVQHKYKFKHLCQRAVDKALQSPNGHLDLFVRFLLGLSLENNQMLLLGLLKKPGSRPNVKEKLVQYIKKKIRDNPSPERSINLFHCLNELNDHTLVEEVQQYLRPEGFFGNKLSPSQWAALVFILLSSQKDLDMFDLKKFCASEEGFLRLLPVVKASKTALLSGCNLSSRSCEALASVFASKNCSLRELDLSNNDLHDTGVMLLSAGLESPQCRLEILRLSSCLVTDTGFASLASALTSNPSHLRELDLSFNHPGDSGVKLLSARRDDQNCKLETLKTDHCGKCRLKLPPLRYFCELSLDPNTAGRNLSLSDDNRRVMVAKEKQPYPDRPERFDSWNQLLCSEGLTGRWYWEVEWEGRVNIGVAYRGIKRKGDSDDCCIGWNDQSWSLICSDQGYTAWHNNTPTDIATPPPTDANRVAVYLDWPAGTVSFYCLPFRVSSLRRIHLHTFHSTFTGPLYPAVGFGRMSDFGTDSKLSSAYLSQIEE